MAYAPPKRTTQAGPASTTPPVDGAQQASASPQPDPAVEHPRIIEEHHVRGPHGEDEIDATDELGRRWYHLRPEPRRRADLIGFNYTWWLVIWVVFLFILLPWGGHWGWGY